MVVFDDIQWGEETFLDLIEHLALLSTGCSILLLCVEVVAPQFFGIAHAMRGWALSCIGRDEEGVAELERALADELRASEIWAALVAALLSEVHMRHGRREAARDLLDQMRSLTESKPTCVFEPEFLRAEAQWLGLAGQEDEARRVLLQAIATAQDHGSLALAVRATLALAHTPSAQNRANLKLLSELCERLPPENNTSTGARRKPWSANPSRPRRARRLMPRG